MTRVLVVDDEPQILRGLKTNLVARGYVVDTAPDGEAALELAARHRPDVVIPQPETVLAAGDELVALAAPESELTLREAIVGD